jgi:hypothetical protein
MKITREQHRVLKLGHNLCHKLKNVVLPNAILSTIPANCVDPTKVNLKMSTSINIEPAIPPTNNTAPTNPVDQRPHDLSTLEEPVHVTIVWKLSILIL